MSLVSITARCTTTMDRKNSTTFDINSITQSMPVDSQGKSGDPECELIAPICTAIIAIHKYTKFSLIIGYLVQSVTNTPVHAIIDSRASISDRSDRFWKPLRPTRL